MESDLTQSAVFLKLWAWGDKNRKQLLYGLIGLVLVGTVVAFWLAHAQQKQRDANVELSKVVSRLVTGPGGEASPDALLKVNSDYPDTDAGQRALLLAAGNLFTQGKYDVAMGEFQKFLKDYNSSPFAGEAALGIASCYDALGKTNDAASYYQGVVDKFATQNNVVAQAQLRLAELLVAQGKFREARTALEDLSRKAQGTTIGTEAAAALQALNAAHPEAPAAPAATAVPNLSVSPATPATTTPNTPAAPTTPVVVAPKAATAPATNKAP